MGFHPQTSIGAPKSLALIRKYYMEDIFNEEVLSDCV